MAHLGYNAVQDANKGGVIFVDNWDKTLDIEKYKVLLKEHLVQNGFSLNTEVTKYSFWKWLGAKFNNRPIANVSIRDRYTSGAPMDRGVAGYAKLGFNNAVVYGKSNLLGENYSPSIEQTIHVTTHELGHAIFSFEHSSTGLMYWRLGGGAGDPYIFNSEQVEIVKQSKWGQ